MASCLTVSEFMTEDAPSSRQCCRLLAGTCGVLLACGVPVVPCFGSGIYIMPARRCLEEVDALWHVPAMLKNGRQCVTFLQGGLRGGRRGGVLASLAEGARHVALLVIGGVGFFVAMVDFEVFSAALIPVSPLRVVKTCASFYNALYRFIETACSLYMRQSEEGFSPQYKRDVVKLMAWTSALSLCLIGGVFPLVWASYTADKLAVNVLKITLNAFLMMSDMITKVMIGPPEG